jgi:hypothetical protein
MSSKLLKILALTIITIGIVIFGVILVRNKNQRDAAQIITNIENPFGVDSDVATFPSGQPSGGSSSQDGLGTVGGSEPITVDFITVEDSPLVNRISSEPVAGATFVYVEREIVVPEEASANLVGGYDFTGYPTLRFGDDREQVADLKTVLNRQNPSPGLNIDTVFDTDLKNAVIDFQTKNSLTPDGIVGSGTYRKLNDMQGIVPKVTKAPEKETIEFVRFVDRASGFIYDKTTRLKEEEKMVSNTSVPRVYEAYFSDDKNSIFMRYLRGTIVENLVAKMVKPEFEFQSGVGSLESSPASSRITFASPLINNQKILYLTKEDTGSDVFTYDFRNGQTKKVWSSRFSDWLPQWVSENTLSLTTRSSGLVPGNSYLLNISGNNLRSVIKNVNGLTTNVSPDGKKIIYSSYEDNSLKTYLLDAQSGSVRDFTPTTLPEKCLWTKDSKTIYCGAPISIPSGLYPDDWYKGINLFSDILWRIDVDTNMAKIIADSEVVPPQTDMINLMVNDKNDYLLFINKHDMNLYGVDLSRLD